MHSLKVNFACIEPRHIKKLCMHKIIIAVSYAACAVQAPAIGQCASAYMLPRPTAWLLRAPLFAAALLFAAAPQLAATLHRLD